MPRPFDGIGLEPHVGVEGNVCTSSWNTRRRSKNERPWRNSSVAELNALVGEWTLTLTNAWFLDSLDVRQRGHATRRWLGEAFVELEAELDGEQLIALYHDPRPTSRLSRMNFADGEWNMLREDPDFCQRFVATVTPDRIDGHWDASDDDGATWRKDFDLIFDRKLNSKTF